jgi:hypothetical protein
VRDHRPGDRASRSCLTARRQESQPRPLRVHAAQEAAGTSVGLRARNSARIGTFKAAPLQEIELCIFGAIRSRSGPHARFLAAGPDEPFETMGERGANGACVRRVGPRTDVSNARS